MDRARRARARARDGQCAAVATAVGILVLVALAVGLAAYLSGEDPLRWNSMQSHLRFHSEEDLDRALSSTNGVIVEGFQPRPHSAPLARLFQRAATPYHPPVQRGVVPLPFSGGVFWVQFTIQGDGNRSRAVLDTGSSSLVVGVKDCRGCDVSMGAMPVPLSSDIRQKDVLIHYGSQSVLADIAVSSLQVRGMALDASLTRRLMGGAVGGVASTLRHEEQRAGGLVSVLHAPTEVHATKHITGETSAHVFGLAPVPDSATAPALLASIFPASHGNASFGVLMGRRAGAWILGSPPPSLRPRMSYVPLRRPRHLQTTPSLFYMMELVDVLVGPSTSQVRTLFRDGRQAPRSLWLMLDTGSSDTYASSQLRGPLRAARAQAAARPDSSAGLFVVLVLQGGVHLVLTPHTYIDMDPSHGIGDSLNLRDSFVDTLLHVQGLLLGATAMRGWYVQHDLPRQRIGFASVASNEVQ